jgi:hypothetical protein
VNTIYKKDTISMARYSTACSQGRVEFIALPASAAQALQRVLQAGDDAVLESFLQKHSHERMTRSNLIFNYPRQQYARLDRGETPESINAGWLTLSNTPYTNPATETVTGETVRLAPITKIVDSLNANNSIIRFVLDVGQFIGAWKTAILIGGPDADSTPGSGKIIAAVNDIRDDSNQPLNRDGTTIHLVNWKLKHLDSSEV